MNRVLKRPMFRMGGSSSGGITSGLDRAPYQFGTKPEDFPGSQAEYDAQMKMLQEKQIGPFVSQEVVDEGMKKLKQKNFDELGFDEGDLAFPMTGQKKKNEFNIEDLKTEDDDVKTEFERRQALADKLLGGSALPMSSFLTQFGLNLASASPRGGLIATAAEAAKEPLKCPTRHYVGLHSKKAKKNSKRGEQKRF